MSHEFIKVRTKAQLAQLADDLATACCFTWDLETAGLDAWAPDAAVVLAAVTVAHARTYTIPLDHPQSVFQRQREALTHWLMARFDKTLDKGATQVLHNASFDLVYSQTLTGIDLTQGALWDTMVSSHLLRPSDRASVKLKEVVPATFMEATNWATEGDIDFSKQTAREMPLPNLEEYAASDAYWTDRLYLYHAEHLFVAACKNEPVGTPVIRDEFEQYRLGELAIRVAMNTVKSTTRLQLQGMPVDLPTLDKFTNSANAVYLDNLNKVAGRYDVELYEGPKKNPRRVEPTLAPTSKYFLTWMDKAVEDGQAKVIARTRTGKPQWDRHALSKLVRQGSDALADVLRARKASKRLEYLGSMREWSRQGVVHPFYRPGTLTTGRLSACLSPDTLIDMPRDYTTYPDGVPMREVKTGDWVYSFDMNMELTLRQVSWVGPTKTAKTVVVTFENSDGEQRTLTCTPDHLIRLYDGTWCHAAYLLKKYQRRSEQETSKRVLGMVRRQLKGTKAKPNDNYVTFFPHSNSRHTPPSVTGEGWRNGSTSGGRALEHRWVAKEAGLKVNTRLDVNHIDGNKANNRPDNLESLTPSEHRSREVIARTDGYGQYQDFSMVYTGKTDWVAVDIEDGPTMEVWDMTVPEDHQFVANGIVVHNSNPNPMQWESALKPVIKAPKGMVVLNTDYSQIELRILAHIAKVPSMARAYKDGEDLHKLTASLVAHVDLADVTKEQRQSAKASNFGLAFGQGAVSFRDYAENSYGVAMTLDEAAELHAKWFGAYPEVADWHADVKERLYKDHQIVSPSGRIRRFPKPWKENENAAINFAVQSLAGDLMQLALYDLTTNGPRHDIYPIGAVHDSIVTLVPASNWQQCATTVEDSMTNRAVQSLERIMGTELTVPILVEHEAGTRWGLTNISHPRD